MTSLLSMVESNITEINFVTRFNFISLISVSLFALLQIYQICINRTLGWTFIVKQSQEVQPLKFKLRTGENIRAIYYYILLL